MAKAVPYLLESRIEFATEALLAEYALVRQVAISIPILIEDIVEKHLKLRLEFNDTHQLFDVPRFGSADPDILGAIFFEDRRIVVDETLDPDENPSKEGRYRFTLAHEVGHWCLHRQYFPGEDGQGGLFKTVSEPSFICRSSQRSERVELQANLFASFLLMPRKQVLAAWRASYPDGKVRILRAGAFTDPAYVVVSRCRAQLGDLDLSESDDDVLIRIARPLAEQFLVSPLAMRIRLEELGLLLREQPRQGILASLG